VVHRTGDTDLEFLKDLVDVSLNHISGQIADEDREGGVSSAATTTSSAAKIFEIIATEVAISSSGWTESTTAPDVQTDHTLTTISIINCHKNQFIISRLADNEIPFNAWLLSR